MRTGGAACGLVAFAHGSGSSRLAPASSARHAEGAPQGVTADAGSSGDRALQALNLSLSLRFLHVLSEDDETVQDVHAQDETAEAPPRVSPRAD
jgi:hypothetical protein